MRKADTAYATAVAPSGDRKFDITVFGCTGNAGRAVALHVLKAAIKSKKVEVSSRKPIITVGLAGRSRDRVQKALNSICEELNLSPGGGDEVQTDIIIADASDATSMLCMTKSTKVLISCAGPFMRYGEAAVLACIEGGAHYVDITGEMPWVSRMESEYGKKAEKAGVALLPFSGYDCVPAELGMYLVAKVLEKSEAEGGGGAMRKLNIAFRSDGGGMPRGTLNTILDSIEGKFPAPKEGDLRFYPKEFRQTAKAALSPLKFLLPSWSNHLSSFTGLNFMAAVNVPVLCRSSATLGLSHDFSISDRLVISGNPNPLNLYGLIETQLYIGGLILAGLVLLFPPFRWFLRGRLEKNYSYGGNANVQLLVDVDASTTKNGSSSTIATAHMEVPGDPGIYATGLFAASVAMALYEGVNSGRNGEAGGDHSPPCAGFHTPVSALHPCEDGLLVRQLRRLGAKFQVTSPSGEELDAARL